MSSKTIFVRRKKRKRKHLFLVLFLVLTVGMFFYISSPSQTEESVQEEVTIPQPTKINSSPRKRVKVKKVRLQDIKNQKNSGRFSAPQKKSDSFPIRDGVSIEQERQFDEILQLMGSQESNEDIESVVKKYRLIERKIKEPLEEEPDENAKEIFIQQFLKNAREGGYEVILGEDLKVISIRKIR